MTTWQGAKQHGALTPAAHLCGMETYDVVVIGSGPGGYVAAIRAAAGFAHRLGGEIQHPWGHVFERGMHPVQGPFGQL